METFGRYSGISGVTDAQRLALDLTNYKPPLLVETTDNGTWKWLGGSAWVQTRSGGAALVSVQNQAITGSNYGANVEVDSITGVAIDTMATGATRVRLVVASVTGTPGPCYVQFGADDTEALANVNATSGSEVGILAFGAPAVGDALELTIPALARNGGKLAAGITSYSDGVNELVLNILQGV